ncbi:hypothetical protein M747DRAFT_355018 [Aspergillus niger ATCC 13496]|uniref:Uncharacterized protein n=3 Tax=Aspergillus niger TaxID=5061 RepID=A2R6S9_ASPNC|nr:hypothetical protein An16g01140 [Aspergillus niger]RDH18256.1 hypothetical protein M747DRAFT_355018 [Aspergillus niger ATCC 13496]CAK97709.1 hypothetical protein An16g01140 [Aspergillus niger]
MAIAACKGSQEAWPCDWFTGVMGMDQINPTQPKKWCPIGGWLKFGLIVGCNDTVTVFRILRRLAKRCAKTWHFHGFTMDSAPSTTTTTYTEACAAVVSRDARVPKAEIFSIEATHTNQQYTHLTSALSPSLEAPAPECPRITVMCIEQRRFFGGSSGTIDVKLPPFHTKLSLGISAADQWDRHTGNSLLTCIPFLLWVMGPSMNRRRGGIDCLTRTWVDTGCQGHRAKFGLPPDMVVTPSDLHCKTAYSQRTAYALSHNVMTDQSEPHTSNIQSNHEDNVVPRSKDHHNHTMRPEADTPSTISKSHLPSHELKPGDDRRPVLRSTIAKHDLPAGGILQVGSFGDIGLGSPHGWWAPSSVATDTGSCERHRAAFRTIRHTYTWLDRYFRLINLFPLGKSTIWVNGSWAKFNGPVDGV